jgi:poly-gamma-glutamate synthesis protein (capsule biosynthesis protein)
LPEAVLEVAQEWASARGLQLAEGQSSFSLNLEPDAGARLVGEQLYVPVMAFPAKRSDITSEELLALWLEGSSSRLLVGDVASEDLTAQWGTPSDSVESLSQAALVDALWSDRSALAIIPFDWLEPRLRPLKVDGLSIVDNRLNQEEWPVALRVWLHGRGETADALHEHLQNVLLVSNREPEKLTVLVMTGVTAMSRSTAWKMEQYSDYAYPARVIGPELATADITHISNEVPFVVGCEANPALNLLTLCSKPEYIDALHMVGVDIVGLTGNHLNDYGFDAARSSMRIYEDHNLPTYGGGVNAEQAGEPLLLSDHGNELAFLGANQFGPDVAWATADNPGSARFDLETMSQHIRELRPRVDLVLAELQYTEAYHTVPLTQQAHDFRALSEAGAHIVTGVQAHQPQAVEFTAQGLILYGLGNLFFDQMNWWETRQGLIPRHVIYDGHHISTELLVTVLEDWAQPRWATEEERQEILGSVFAASGW